METLYKIINQLKSNKVIIGAFILFSFSLNAQRIVDINAIGSNNSVELSLDQRGNDNFFSEAKRARFFKVNPTLKNPLALNKGDQIKLELFQDKIFSSKIISKSTDINGVSVLTIKLQNFDYAFGYITISKNSYLMKIDIPELNEKYTTRKNPKDKSNYLFLLDPSSIDILEECLSPKRLKQGDNERKEFPKTRSENIDQNSSSIELATLEENTINYCVNPSSSQVVIDLIIVYTQSAENWANLNDNGINNSIATAVAIANSVASNNNLGINFNLVYSGLVNYNESTEGSSADLVALALDNDGKMDEIHNIRKQLGGDMVAIFTSTNDVGGMAYLLNNKYGDPDVPFSLTRIQQASIGYTFIHELGHNMGAMHNKDQSVQPGPTNWSNWEENTWSGGWRWLSDDDNMYGSVMTYQSGGYYVDGLSTTRIPYFSDPEHLYLNGIAGNSFEGDNSRTLEVIKNVVSNYSNSLVFCDAKGGDSEAASIDKVSFGQIDNSTNKNGYSNFSEIRTCLFPQETQDLKINVSGISSNKEVLVWIDWNDDKIFDNSSELEYRSIEDLSEYITGITVPLGVNPGVKRLRIRLHDKDSNGNITPCGDSEFGEVEDYSINVMQDSQCSLASVPQNIGLKEIQSQSITLGWDPIEGISSYSLKYRVSGAENWSIKENIFYSNYKIEGLQPSTGYEIQVQSRCGVNSISNYSSPIIITTEVALGELRFVEHPLDAETGVNLSISIEILDINGDRSNSKDVVNLNLNDNDLTGAKLSGYLKVNAIDGLATFNDLSINLEGSYSLEASTIGLPITVSNTFTILPHQPKDFIVNTVEDNEDVDLADGICADINGNCSLRAAIQNANRTLGKDFIYFNIAGESPYKISLLKNLPAIKAPLVLDATTQPEYLPGYPVIVLSGKEIPISENNVAAIGLHLVYKSSESIIKGLVLGDFGVYTNDTYQVGIAINISNTTNHIIQGNYIGLASDGESKVPNVFGIVLGEPENLDGKNLIGGSKPEERNFISGNSRYGINIGYYGSQNIIIGNYVGTNREGTIAIGNKTGISVGVWAHDNLITENLVSGNIQGIEIRTDHNIISKNYIGTNYNGTLAIPNDKGVLITGNYNTIGYENFGNLISGNNIGVSVTFSENNIISGNLIGTDVEGISAIPNNTGIRFNGSINNKIGGSTSASANTISGNFLAGVHLYGSSNYNEIYGNYIGVLKDGSQLGNGGDGIHLGGSYQTIIGGEEGKPNLIAFNGGAGVAITEYGNNNKISQNRIYSNASLGIDLGGNGSTANDRDDRDYGPNNFQNSPELITSAALEGSVLQLEYLIKSVPQYSAFPITVEFFKSDGSGQGKEYLGTDIYTENDISKGRKGKMISLQLVPGSILNGGDKVLATATDTAGNTSEFGNSADVTGGCTETIYYADNDGDGFGDPMLTEYSCTQPEGYVKNNTDCDDSQDTIYPGSVDDTVDGIDQNCDGTDGPVTSCTGADVISVKEICSTATLVTWEITNPSTCQVDGRWELRKNSSTGNSSGSFSLIGGETMQFTSGVVSKGKTQIVVYWNDSTGLEISSNQNASGIECSTSQSSLTQSSDSEVFYISPNPISDADIGMFFPIASSNTVLTAVIYDMNGRKIASENFNVQAGTGYLLWNLEYESWTDGTYILNVSIEDQIYQTMFIK